MHLAGCAACLRELESLQTVIDCFSTWPVDVLRPGASVQVRLASQISTGTGEPLVARARSWSEPPWKDVAAGIACKLLARDTEHDRISMVVRLAPGASYPAHRHAAVEELHLLSGELWIDDRKLVAGDYNVGLPGENDRRVWSETGCTCVLVTSTKDRLEA